MRECGDAERERFYTSERDVSLHHGAPRALLNRAPQHVCAAASCTATHTAVRYTQFYPRELNSRISGTHFYPRVVILARAKYSLLPSTGWSTESQPMGFT